MKTKILTGALLVPALLAFGIRALPQQASPDKAQQGQTAPCQQNQGMMGQGQGMMGQGQGMMGGNQGMMGQGQGMMGGDMPMMMSQMATHHQEMTTLMSKLMESMKAIQAEKNPAALKSKLAEHQALLEQMHSRMTQQGKMMQMKPGNANPNCPGANGNVQPSTGG
ncbi:MAG: hypothetical protein LAO19_01675 [Acidobacteriia bacterium]|nr:hypothetical protein [Terriglobia bacterium]